MQVLLETLLEEVAKLVHRFPKVVELSEEKVKVESKGLVAKAMVARRVFTKTMAHEFQQRARLKGMVAAFNMNQGYPCSDSMRLGSRSWF